MNITVLGLTNPDVDFKRMHQLYNVTLYFKAQCKYIPSNQMPVILAIVSAAMSSSELRLIAFLNTFGFRPGGFSLSYYLLPLTGLFFRLITYITEESCCVIVFSILVPLGTIFYT